METEYKVLTDLERLLKDGIEDGRPSKIEHSVTVAITIIKDRKDQLFNSPDFYGKV